MVRVRVGVGVKVGLELIILGTLSLYYYAHSITQCYYDFRFRIHGLYSMIIYNIAFLAAIFVIIISFYSFNLTILITPE